MGYLTTPTPEMGPFSIEHRNQSAIVQSKEPRFFLIPSREGSGRGWFEVDRDDIPAVIAALQQSLDIEEKGAQRYEAERPDREAVQEALAQRERDLEKASALRQQARSLQEQADALEST